MPLLPLQFKDLQDVRDKLTDYCNQYLIEWQENHFANVRNKALLFSTLYEQLIVDSNGDTYSLNDIDHLSDEEAENTALAFPIKQRNERGDLLIWLLPEIKSLINDIKVNYQLKHKIFSLIHNRPLVTALLAISVKNLGLIWDDIPILHPLKNDLPLLFPVITPEEKTYESIFIENVLTPLENQGKLAADPLSQRILRTDDLLPNHALEQLIQIDIMSRLEVINIKNQALQLPMPSEQASMINQELQHLKRIAKGYKAIQASYDQILNAEKTRLERIEPTDLVSLTDNIKKNYQCWSKDVYQLERLNYLSYLATTLFLIGMVVTFGAVLVITNSAVPTYYALSGIIGGCGLLLTSAMLESKVEARRKLYKADLKISKVEVKQAEGLKKIPNTLTKINARLNTLAQMPRLIPVENEPSGVSDIIAHIDQEIFTQQTITHLAQSISADHKKNNNESVIDIRPHFSP